MHQYGRSEVHARLRETINRDEPLIIAGAGI